MAFAGKPAIGEQDTPRRARVMCMREATTAEGSENVAPDDSVAMWFDLHVDDLFRYTSRRVGGDAARDVVSETFRIALERRASFDPSRGSERAWLFGIATNVIRRFRRTEDRVIRNQVRAFVREPPSIDPLLAVERSVDAALRWEHLAEAVTALADDDRDLLTLVAWEGMSSAEAAAVLDISPGTVRSRLHRIRTELAARERDHHG